MSTPSFVLYLICPLTSDPCAPLILPSATLRPSVSFICATTVTRPVATSDATHLDKCRINRAMVSVTRSEGKDEGRPVTHTTAPSGNDSRARVRSQFTTAAVAVFEPRAHRQAARRGGRPYTPKPFLVLAIQALACTHSAGRPTLSKPRWGRTPSLRAAYSQPQCHATNFLSLPLG